MNPHYSYCDSCRDYTYTYHLSSGQPMCQLCGKSKSLKRRPLRDMHQVHLDEDKD